MIINKINEEFKFYQLENGLKVYLYNNDTFTNLYANYTVNFGSIDTNYKFNNKEYHDSNGIAHYLEHLMFANNDEDYFDLFAKYGANSNAYTSFTQTSYLINATDDYKKCLEVLIEMVQTLKLTPKRVKEEFGVIKEEIEMYNSKPNYILQNLLFENLCTSNYKYDIAGSVDSISLIDYKHIQRLFDIFYKPSNCTLFIAGNLNFDINFIKEIQKIKTTSEQPILLRELEQFKVNSNYNVHPHKLANNTQIMIGKKLEVCENMNQLILQDISMEIFIDWLTSDLNPDYDTAIKENEINETLNCYHMLDLTANALIFKIRIDCYEKVINYIESQLKTITCDIIEVLKRKKIGSEIKLFNNPETICEYQSSFILRGIDLNEYYNTLFEIDNDLILKCIKNIIENSIDTIQILTEEKRK